MGNKPGELDRAEPGLPDDPTARALALACSYWPTLELTAAQALAARRQWQDIPYPCLVAALDLHARTDRWWPGPGVIAATALLATKPDLVPAGVALVEVRKQIVAHGRYGTPALAPAAKAAVEALGGWWSVCGMNADYFPAVFTKAYSAIVDAERRVLLTPPSLVAIEAAV